MHALPGVSLESLRYFSVEQMEYYGKVAEIRELEHAMMLAKYTAACMSKEYHSAVMTDCVAALRAIRTNTPLAVAENSEAAFDSVLDKKFGRAVNASSTEAIKRIPGVSYGKPADVK